MEIWTPIPGSPYRPVAYRPARIPAEESVRTSAWLRRRMTERRTVRMFSPDPVDEQLTHTSSPMRFLGEILGRPRNEKAFAVIPVGYPAEEASVPDLVRKQLEQVLFRV